jgi:hypothetical protein
MEAGFIAISEDRPIAILNLSLNFRNDSQNTGIENTDAFSSYIYHPSQTRVNIPQVQNPTSTRSLSDILTWEPNKYIIPLSCNPI